MQRRQFLRTVLGGFAGRAVSAQPARKPPNIVLVLIDDMGWMDLGCQGSTFYETPEIDRIAREGTRFTNAYANCPVCSPSRAAIMTGRYPHRVHFTGHITSTGKHRYPPKARIIPPDDNLFLRLEEVTIAEALKPAGYVSASIGKWHLGLKGMWPEQQGFDLNVAGYEQGSPPSHFYPYTNSELDWNPAIPTLKGGKPGEYLTDRLTDEAIHFVEQNRQKPFFLYLPLYAVHTPLQTPPTLTEKYERKMQRDHSQTSAVYGGMVDSVDRNVGRLRKALERLRLLDDTIIVVTSDNGGEPKSTNNAPLRAGKGSVYEGGIRVPLVVRWPGQVRAGAVADTPAMGADLFPTLLDLAGITPPAVELDGLSLKPWLAAKAPPSDRDLIWYYPHYSPQYQQPGAALRSGNLKLIELYDPPRVELFDLAADPSEKTDLSQRMPEKTAELRRRLQQHLKATGTILHTPNPAASR